MSVLGSKRKYCFRKFKKNQTTYSWYRSFTCLYGFYFVKVCLRWKITFGKKLKVSLKTTEARSYVIDIWNIGKMLPSNMICLRPPAVLLGSMRWQVYLRNQFWLGNARSQDLLGHTIGVYGSSDRLFNNLRSTISTVCQFWSDLSWTCVHFSPDKFDNIAPVPH